jgi:hypothetical protein
VSPSAQPTAQPTKAPTSIPSSSPTAQPISQPTNQPIIQPTFHPTKAPTFIPTKQPSNHPTSHPTKAPTFAPTDQPTNNPTFQPTKAPTFVPTMSPTIIVNPVDIVFLVDTTSGAASTLGDAQILIKDTIDALPISDTANRVSVVQFTNAIVNSTLLTQTNPAAIASFVDNLKINQLVSVPSQTTALNYVRNTVLTPQNLRNGVNRLVVLITNMNSVDLLAPTALATLIAEDGIKSLVLPKLSTGLFPGTLTSVLTSVIDADITDLLNLIDLLA